MAYLLVNKHALAHNLSAVGASCRALGAEFMLVFKEAGARPELLRFMLGVGACDRAGFCHYPGAVPAMPAGMAAHLLYMAADRVLPQVAGGYDVVYQTSPRSIALLADEARKQHRQLRLVLPVELGDGRDGIVPEELPRLADHIAALTPQVELWGLAGNFACISERPPRMEDLHTLLAAQRAVEEHTGRAVPHVSVGGSDILQLAAHQSLPDGITEIRCGTAVYLGVYPLDGQPVPGLNRQAVRLGAQVMECARKNGSLRAVFDFGVNDTHPDCVTPPHPGMIFQGASSGYSIFDVSQCPISIACGEELLFGLHHRSLARALASPHVALRME